MDKAISAVEAVVTNVAPGAAALKAAPAAVRASHA